MAAGNRRGKAWESFTDFPRASGCLLPWMFLDPSSLHPILASSNPSRHLTFSMYWPNISCPSVSLKTSARFTWISSTSNDRLPPILTSPKNLLLPGPARLLLYANVPILTSPQQKSPFNLNQCVGSQLQSVPCHLLFGLHSLQPNVPSFLDFQGYPCHSYQN